MGPHKNKWDVSGTVVESLGFDSYHVKMDGSGQVTKRNRRFLRPILPYSGVMARPPTEIKDNVVIQDIDRIVLDSATTSCNVKTDLNC